MTAAWNLASSSQKELIHHVFVAISAGEGGKGDVVGEASQGQGCLCPLPGRGRVGRRDVWPVPAAEAAAGDGRSSAGLRSPAPQPPSSAAGAVWPAPAAGTAGQRCNVDANGEGRGSTTRMEVEGGEAAESRGRGVGSSRWVREKGMGTLRRLQGEGKERLIGGGRRGSRGRDWSGYTRG